MFNFSSFRKNKGFTQHHFSLKSSAGFTLIEMLITLLIFSVVIGVVIGLFVSAIRLQKYNLIHQQLLDQTSYAMEYMERAIRMAQKDDGTCDFSGYNYDVSSDGTKLEFKSYSPDYGCQEFSLQNGRLRVENEKVDDFLTSDDFEITSLNFEVTGESDADNLQPRVTIFMEIEGTGLVSPPKISIQTTVSQRNLDRKKP